jgi:hypothetical protein
VYGGPSDTWGETLTPSIINSADFGVAISADCAAYGYPRVDAVTVTVYYVLQVLLDTNASSVASVSANLSTSILLAGVPSSIASSSANLTTSITFGCSAAIQASVSATLTSSPTFIAGIATATVSSSSNLTTIIKFASVASCVSSASAVLYLPITPSTDFAVGIFLAEVQAYDPATSAVVTHRFSSGQGYDNAGTFYLPRIEQPATYRREAGGSTVGGRQQSSVGELTLINSDGALSYMADDFYDGRTLTIKWGNRNALYADFTTVLVATIDSISFERQRVSVRIKDRSNTLDKPFSSVKYTGDNVLPLGLEGTSDNLKGQNKPRIFGRVALMQPQLVNTSHLIYQVSDKAITGNVLNVFDAGALLFRQTPDYTDINTLQAAGQAPGEGYYKCFSSSAGTYFRIGSAPYGTISCSVIEDWDYLDCSASGIIKKILTELGFVSGTDWVESDFTALNQVCAGSLGVIVNAEETTSSIIDRICATIGAYWGFDNLNRFRIARIDAPSGTPVAVFTEDNTVALEKRADSEYPAWQITMAADVNYAVQDKSSLAGVVSTERAAWFSEAARNQVSASSPIKTSRLLAEDRKYEQSLWSSISQADAEADRRLSVFGVRRDSVTLTVADPLSYYDTIDIGSIVSVTNSRIGYNGKLFTVTGVYIDYQRGLLDLILYG